MTELDDARIAQRLMARDEAALTEAIEAHGPSVLGMARRVINDPTLAEEVAQDTFVALWRRPGAFDPERGPLRAFLMGVSRNKAVDLVRKESSHRRSRDALMAEAEALPATAEDPALEGIESRIALRSAMAELSGVQREALTLAYIGGRTYREVAEELGIPEGTAKTRLRDGLIRLRELISMREVG